MAMPKECGAESFGSTCREESLEGRKQCDDAKSAETARDQASASSNRLWKKRPWCSKACTGELNRCVSPRKSLASVRRLFGTSREGSRTLECKEAR